MVRRGSADESAITEAGGAAVGRGPYCLYADDAVRTQRSRGYSAPRLHQKMDQARLESGDLLSHASDANLRRPTSGSRWTNRTLLFHMLFGYLIVRRLPFCGDTVKGDAVSAGDPDAPTAQASLPSV